MNARGTPRSLTVPKQIRAAQPVRPRSRIKKTQSERPNLGASPVIVTKKVLSEILVEHPIEIILPRSVAVRSARHDEQIESLVCSDQRIGKTNRSGWVHIVIHVTVHKKQASLEIARDFRIRRHMNFEA